MSKTLPCIIISVFIAGCSGISGNTNPAGRPLPAKSAAIAHAEAEEPSRPQSGFEIEEPTGALTLRQALALTLLNNPALKVYSFELRAAEVRALQAGLRPNPQLDIEVENFAGSGALSGFDEAETTIAISQLMESGRKAEKRKKLAAMEGKIIAGDYEAAKVKIAAQAQRAFIDLLAAQQRAGLLAELTEISQRALSSVEQRVESGKDSPLEKTKASVALSSTRIEQQQANTSLEKARKAMAAFWGSEPLFTQALGNLTAIKALPDIDLLKQKLAANPQLAIAVAQIARDRAALELAKANGKPDITVAGGVRRLNGTDENAFVFGVSIPLPFSDRNQGRRHEAAANLSKSQQLKRVALTEATNRLNGIYLDYTDSLNRISELEKSVLPGAEEVFEASQEGYARGKFDYLNVLDAQRTYFISKCAYLDALATCHKAMIDLDELTGRSLNAAAVQ